MPADGSRAKVHARPALRPQDRAIHPTQYARGPRSAPQERAPPRALWTVHRGPHTPQYPLRNTHSGKIHLRIALQKSCPSKLIVSAHLQCGPSKERARLVSAHFARSSVSERSPRGAGVLRVLFFFGTMPKS